MSAFTHILLCRKQPTRRSFGRGVGTQDVCVITLLKSPWLIHPSLLLVPPFLGGRSSGEIMYSSSSVWRRPYVQTNASGKAQTIEQVWETYFDDPSQWWDNRFYKKNPQLCDFQHKVTKKALWVDGWSTPAWTKAMRKFGTQSKLPSDVGYRTNDSQEIVQPNRLRMSKFGRRNTLPTSAREAKQIGQVGGVSMQMRSAKTTSEAIDVLKNRLQQGIAIDSYMYVEILKRCLMQEDLPAVKQVHECIIKSGMQQNSYVANKLVIVYIRCGRLEDARRVFDELVKKDVVSWNVMIGGYAQHNCAEDAMEAFNQMHQEGVQPNPITYLSILKACTSPSALQGGKEVHTHIRRGDMESDVRVSSALVSMYAKCGSIDDARLVFDRMEERNVISWTAMIGAYAESGRGEEAYRLFLQMIREGFQPNAVTYASILNARASAGALEWVKEVHSHAQKGGFESDIRVNSALVHMYAKCGSIDDARLVFDRMEKRDVVSWTVMIRAYAENGCGEEAYRLFLLMIREGFKPNAFTYASILSACARAGASEWVREVHNYAREGGFESDLRVGIALVHMYAKCGSIDDARLVFDRMEKRDVISWNVMIGAYAESGRGEEAYRLFLQMIREGFKPSSATYVGILNTCASAGALEWVKHVHSHARDGGFGSDVRVGNALVRMYAKCGSIDDARLVFDRMEERNVMTWNMMIGAYARSGCGNEAYRLFLQLISEGFRADAYTYSSILNICASAGALKWVKEVHNHARDGGFESDMRVSSALVHMYAKCGSIDDARLVFDRMEDRDVMSWNVMIGAYAESGCGEEACRLFLQMIREGFKPNSATYVSILNTCASAGALEWMKEVHSHVYEGGFESDVRVGSALVHMYAKCGSIADARLVFDRMEERNVISWTVMIGAYAESGRGEEAYRLFLQMIREGFKPNSATYVSILNACASAGALEWVKHVHSHAREGGFESDIRVSSALVHMYAKCGSIDDARLVFDRMVDRDLISWNGMIGSYADNGCGEEAYRLFFEMRRAGFQPNAVTYVSTLNACASVGALDWVKEVHRHALEGGFESDVRVGNALLHVYAKCGSIDDARLVFDRVEKRNVISWTVMIGTYAENGSGEEAYQLFLQMIREGFKPNAFTYTSILNACASAGALEWVKEVHRLARDGGFESEVRVGSALVHMYAKCGSIDDARLVFDRMEERDLISWNVMIGGLAQHGCGSEALEVLRKMNASGVKPDGSSFVAVLSACSHSGLVDEGRQLLVAMSEEYGIASDVQHLNCMVDILGRAGRLEEAKLFIDKMPVEPTAATWGSLLGACRSYGNVELGELAAQECLRLEPENASTYVLLSNIYAAAKKWEKVSMVRSMLQERGIRKEPGRSWIEVDNKIHTFVTGDTSHSETKEIYAELTTLTEKIKAEGYFPDTRLVLHDIDKKDKEFSLCSHSEKLAITYGLMCTPSRKPIRVYKNLRACSDCHMAIKLISKVTRREIVVRDAIRFHHFKDGLCSCKDYW